MSKTKVAAEADQSVAAENVVTSKRKRSEAAVDEIEIDVNLPEPPSKKAKRKEKKGGLKKSGSAADKQAVSSGAIAATRVKQTKDDLADLEGTETKATVVDGSSAQKKGEHGVWIGNLPFTATRTTLRTFLKDEVGIEEDDIVRLHLPGPTKSIGRRPADQHNRGFAYIDFASKELVEKVIALSERELDGRNVLIKDAHNFEGRPAKQEQSAHDGEIKGEKDDAKVKTKRVFVGNLGFDVTREDLFELYTPAGEVEDVFLATFEDSGKCKGFGWVMFATAEAAEAAVKGYLYREVDGDEDVDDGKAKMVTEKKDKPKREKVWINRLQGRQLRCEFAEDAQTRYKKRFSKDAGHTQNSEAGGRMRPAHIKESREHGPAHGYQDRAPSKAKSNRASEDAKEDRRAERRRRHDARTVAPGQALANAPRASGAIVAGSGQKLRFD